jgi:SPP1 gp7 family putative phage head morphogenesis protein
MELAFSDAEIALDVQLDFSVENKLVQAVLDELATLVTRITDTTRDDIRELIGKQAAEGWSIDRLAKELIAAGAVSSSYRAKMIARTETASAYSKATILAYQISDVVDSIEWLATIDDDTCEHCVALNGTTTKLGKAFADGTDHPPRHPNCRCAVSAILKK